MQRTSLFNLVEEFAYCSVVQLSMLPAAALGKSREIW